MLVLDTDTLSIVQFGRDGVADRLRERIRESRERAVTTIVSFEEQMRGWLAKSNSGTTPEDYVRAARNLRALLDDFRHRDLLDFDDPAAAAFARLKTAKVRIGTMDLRIAAITLANKATLITGNLRDFEKVPGLRAEDWTHGVTA